MKHAGRWKRLCCLTLVLCCLWQSALAYDKLEKGASGQQVLIMQQALASLNYGIETDGKYGPATERVVKAFQRKHDLTVDGVAGNKTLELLYSLAPGFAQAASAAPAPTAAPAPADISGVPAVVSTTGGSLNLRRRASGSADVIATIPFGASLTVTSRGAAWCAVYYDGLTGYVMTQFLRFPGDSAATPVPAAAPTAQPITPIGQLTAQVATPGGSLNLREAPRDNAKVRLTIPQGAYVTVTARGDSWCGVIYLGVSGYVMSKFLNFGASPVFTAPTLTPTAAPAASPTPLPTLAPTAAPVIVGASGVGLVTTSGGTLNLREAPSDTARVIAQLPNAAAITVLAKGDAWSSVVYNGMKGYVMSRFITVLGSAEITENEPQDEDPSAFTRVLKKGMTGADVTWVQERLISLGYALAATNVYDDATFAAVKAFQTKNGLTADGLAGSQTFSILKSGSARAASDAPLSYATLRIDDTGDGVKQLQSDLKALGYPVTVNGTYDVGTHNAVVAFQQRNSLVISGIADGLTRQVLHGGGGKPYSTPVSALPADAGKMTAPAVSQLKLLHWQNEIKPAVKAGQSFTVYDPNTGLGWTLVFYSLGRHADSQPATWQDTQIMNKSFGSTSWNIHPVYVKLPSGQWTMATMHNRPHLYGTIADNGFGGHLCVHFLRDMAEAQKNDPNYGVNNQVTLRNAWKALTGETIN